MGKNKDRPKSDNDAIISYVMSLMGKRKSPAKARAARANLAKAAKARKK